MPTRSRIIEAAADELATRDESAFRVTRVARNAGCATSVMYHYFGSRAGLLDAGFLELASRLEAAGEAHDDAYCDLARFAEDLASFLAAARSAEASNDRRAVVVMEERLLGASSTRSELAERLRSFAATRRERLGLVVQILRERRLVSSEVDPMLIQLALEGAEAGWRSGVGVDLERLAAALAR